MERPSRSIGGVLSFAQVDIATVRRNRGWFVALGIALMLLGMLAIVLPLVASLVTTMVIGWLMIVAGVVEGYHALANRAWEGSSWEIVSALVELAGGVFVIAFPIAGKLALTVILTGYFAVTGFLKLIRATQHRAVRTSAWLVFDGLLSLLLALFMVLHWPAVAVWVFGLFVGIHLFAGGLSMMLIATGVRREARA